MNTPETPRRVHLCFWLNLPVWVVLAVMFAYLIPVLGVPDEDHDYDWVPLFLLILSGLLLHGVAALVWWAGLWRKGYAGGAGLMAYGAFIWSLGCMMGSLLLLWLMVLKGGRMNPDVWIWQAILMYLFLASLYSIRELLRAWFRAG